MKRVLVLNHFAAPSGSPGGTRHVELFTRMDGWQGRIIASNRILLTGERPRGDHGGVFTTVWCVPYTKNDYRRVLNWVSYAITATIAGLRSERPDIVYASSPHLLSGLAG